MTFADPTLPPLSTAIGGTDSAQSGSTLGNNVFGNSATLGVRASATTQPNPDIGGGSPGGKTQEILFISTDLPNYRDLVAQARSNTAVFLLNPKQDGVAQISKVLAQYQNIAALHIVSYGSAANVELGTANLNLNTLDRYSSNLQQWGKSLSADADIVFYGSAVGLGAVDYSLGNPFMQRLSQLTGADIAASDNATGSQALGGDWVLEVNTGEISAQLAFQASVVSTYGSVFTR
jgi:Domain of unknown function (DUF4347)